ncbi:hypothetical protein [Arthrobacter sp. StoSoilB5]|uniref:hypothetical protein n=1 Tax=Arthrobacter sp. StoSoilB5 TaxID=2830992 RepID=UPI001CC4914D|nr:hypothetical protein [Arthrobacter sp. StoSoilB5]BCW43168.1 hypothetical protein StoSoilB5_03520 [Arthrobacter sp. StoSoilB5]
MEALGSVWVEVFTVAFAWLTVVCQLIARVPKPPSLLEEPLEDEHPGNSVPAAVARQGRLRHLLAKPRAARRPRPRHHERATPNA